MTLRHLLCAGALALPAFVVRPIDGSHGVGALVSATEAAAHDAVFATVPPGAWAQADPADSLYRAARDLLNRNDYRRAAELFAQITSRYPKSTYAPDALYWRAFALYRIGGEDDLREALRALTTQRSRYPKAATTADANALDVRIHGALAQRGDAPSAERVSKAASEASSCSGNERDDNGDVRVAAINALLHMDAERAVPIIKQVLSKRDDCSVPLRQKAVFLLSQKQTAETEALMLDVAQHDPNRRVREEAVQWMGQLDSDRATAALEDIALRSPDEGLREKAVWALSEQDRPRGLAIVRRVAESENASFRVRDKAVFQLGQRRSPENAQFLRALFGRLAGADNGDRLRRSILFSLSQMKGEGNDRWLLSVAADESQSVEVRKHALWTAGEAGVTSSEFIPLYDRVGDRRLKEQLIWVLSQSKERAAADKLIDIARNDRDPEMRKKAIFWLGQMHDPRVQQLLLDIINKG